jgi:hypothetical protein
MRAICYPGIKFALLFLAAGPHLHVLWVVYLHHDACHIFYHGWPRFWLFEDNKASDTILYLIYKMATSIGHVESHGKMLKYTWKSCIPSIIEIFKGGMAGMFLAWSCTKLLFFCVDEKYNMATETVEINTLYQIIHCQMAVYVPVSQVSTKYYKG